MRKILTTFGTGPAREALKISLPLMAAYALRHGYDLFVPSDSAVDYFCQGRPPSWGKVNLIHALLLSNPKPEFVVWLDADVVPVRMDRDIARDAWEPGMSVVVQNTPDGAVPSCGVIVARAGDKLVGFLRNVFGDNYNWSCAGQDGMGLKRSNGWWEQAAIIKALGGDPDQTPIVTPPKSDLWAELPYEWNPHPCDSRGVPENLRFFHATATNDRLGDMKTWAARADA